MKKNGKYLIIISLMIVIKLLLITVLHPYIKIGYLYDDKLMLDLTNNIISGNWLGEYNSLTLTKGFMYPLFASLIYFLKIPYLLGIELLYIIAIIIFIKGISGIVRNKLLITIFFFILLFSPISYSADIFLRFYRNGFNLSIIMIYFGLLFSIIDSNLKINIKNIIRIILFSFVTFVLINTREDFIWLFPSLIIVISFIVFKGIKKEKLAALIIISTILIFNTSIKIINNNYYNSFTRNDFTSGAFAKTYNLILKVEDANESARISIPESKLQNIANYSESFKSLYLELKKNHSNLEMIDGHIMWFMRSAAENLGHYKNSETAKKYWETMYNEINFAIEKKELLLKKRNTISPLIPPIKKQNIIPISIGMYSISKNLVLFKNITINQEYSENDIKLLNDFSKISNQEAISSKSNSINNQNKLSIEILNYVSEAYQILLPFVFIIFIISIVYNIRYERKRKFWLYFGILLVSILINILGLAYTDASTFPTNRYYYIAPLYNLYLAFAFISISNMYLKIKQFTKTY